MAEVVAADEQVVMMAADEQVVMMRLVPLLRWLREPSTETLAGDVAVTVVTVVMVVLPKADAESQTL